MTIDEALESESDFRRSSLPNAAACSTYYEWCVTQAHGRTLGQLLWILEQDVKAHDWEVIDES